MTAYNKTLDKLITDYATHLEKNVKDAINPRVPAAASLLRIAFRTVVTGDVLLAKIYDQLGWEKFGADPYERARELADLAEKNDNLAAALSLRFSVNTFDKIARAAKSKLPEGTGTLKVLKEIKKLKLG
ncbi:MAG: hypothetical protein PSY14_00150 [bacterium]|nr:hypothetical protein [bacterium]